MRSISASHKANSKALYRRQFLRGAGGFSLALPILPSLFPRHVLGQPIADARPNFCALSTEHGAVSVANMYPLATPTETSTALPGHNINSGPLIRNVISSGKRTIAPVLSADSNTFSERLVSKMNVLRGLDIPYGMGHNVGGHLGNYAAAGDATDGPKGGATPTIDQVMAWSKAFYRAGDPFKRRSIQVGVADEGLSFDYSNPSARSGPIQRLASVPSSKAVFDDLFSNLDRTTPTARRPLIVDRIIANYRSLRDGNRRLSVSDKKRLDDHIARLAELERAVNVSVPASCLDIPTPTQTSNSFSMDNNTPADHIRHHQLINDVVAAAFICGLTRVATVRIIARFSNFAGNWHQDVAHQHYDPAKQRILADALQLVFGNVIVDLAKKLDVDTGTGRNLLDDTLIQWTQEAGRNAHITDSIPVVTFGSAAGFFKTGLYVDYRNRSTVAQIYEGHEREPDSYTGLLYNRWLATALQAMRIPDTEWKRTGMFGYGLHPGYKFFGPKIVGGGQEWTVPLCVPGMQETSNQKLPIVSA
jgi:Protein of unknown function (DUF1552)